MVRSFFVRKRRPNVASFSVANGWPLSSWRVEEATERSEPVPLDDRSCDVSRAFLAQRTSEL